MTQLLLESIAVALNKTFDDGYTVYQENVEQGLREPCFFVQCLETNRTLFRGVRYFRTHTISIQYFPASREKPKAECEVVAQQLFDALERLPLRDGQATLRGKEARYRIIDGVLYFFVEYDCFEKKKVEIDKMRTLTISVEGERNGTRKNNRT